MDALNENLADKVAVVTGATGGIGKEIARNLARMGATVVIGARSPDKAQAVKSELVAQLPNAKIELITVDTSNMSSVRKFATEVSQRWPKLNILVNNAGSWTTTRAVTGEGHEVTLATNVLGPQLLTELLLPALKASGSGRIVNLVSELANNLDVSDLQWARRSYDGFKVYAASKQAFRMLTWGWAKKLEGTGVTINGVSPGFVKTDFNRNAHGFMATMINLMSPLMALTPAQGSDTPTWAAVSPEVANVSGKFFAKRKEKECKYRDPAQIAELESAVQSLIENGPATLAPGSTANAAQPRA